MKQQDSFLNFDPSTGKTDPFPFRAHTYRDYHGRVAWLFNPWTGISWDPRDIGSDTFGYLIIPPGEKVHE